MGNTGKSSTGYCSGNLADRIKNSNLRVMLDRKAKRDFVYIELHSGEGVYRQNGSIYHGTSFRALDMARRKNVRARFFLHESNEKSNNVLYKNLRGMKDVSAVKVVEGNELSNGQTGLKCKLQVSIGGDWRKNIDFYIRILGGTNTLVVSDPTLMTDHLDVIKYLPEILRSGSDVFMYIPVSARENQHYSVVDSTRRIIVESGRRAVDLRYPVGSGYCERIDHNLIVTSKVLRDELERNHKSKINREIWRRRMKLSDRVPYKDLLCLSV